MTHHPIFHTHTQGEGTAELGMGGVSTWEVIDQYQWSDDEGDKAKKRPKTAPPSNAEKTSKRGRSTLDRVEPDVIEIKSDSEEEETVVLTKDDFSREAAAETKPAATGPSLAELVALESQKEVTKLSVKETKPAATGPSLTELVALESQKEVTKLSVGVQELSTAEPSESSMTATSVSPAKSKQRKGRGRRGEKKDSASPVDIEVVSVTPPATGRGGARDGSDGRGAQGGKMRGGGQRTYNSGAGSGHSRGRGKRRKSNTKTQ